MASSYQLQTLARALDVLELMERTPEPMSLTEIAEAMGEATAIVYRILHTLEARGYLYRRPQDKRYSYTGRSTGAGAVSRAVDLLQAASRAVPRGRPWSSWPRTWAWTRASPKRFWRRSAKKA